MIISSNKSYDVYPFCVPRASWNPGIMGLVFLLRAPGQPGAFCSPAAVYHL